MEFTNDEFTKLLIDLKTGIKHYLIVNKLNFIVLIWLVFFGIYI